MRRLLPALLVLLSAPGALAQGQNNYGSIYSLYGLGERLDHASSQASMLGGSGVATRDGLYLGLGSPALWSDQSVTTFSASASVTGLRATDALTDETSRATYGDLAALHLGIPVLPGRLGLAFSYRPYSRVNYRASVDGVLASPDGDAPFTTNLEGAGGLQRISGGLGVRIGRAVQLGAAADVVFGNEEYLQRTTFDESTYLETRRARSTQLRGVTATFGAAATAVKLASDTDALTVAGALTLPTRFDVGRSITLGQSIDRDTLAAEVDGSATAPLLARLGLAYRTGGRWLLTAEGLYEPWSQFESTIPVGGYTPAAGSDPGLDLLHDRLRIGGGVELTPAGGARRAPLLSRAAYRLGGYAERGLYAPTGADLTTYAVTGGLSLPNRLTGARFDLGGEVGTRGSTDGVLVRDVFVRGSLTINFGERWFTRRRID